MDSDQDEKIREIAYRLWEEAGRPAGRDLDIWLEAEAAAGKPAAKAKPATAKAPAKAPTPAAPKAPAAKKAPAKKG
ncbi:MAG: DUF2934 domain-containing protein [Magnetospirillum sp.]|nr:DUF2934 domain-containing protein [Magnetospirillum sp.]